MCWLTKISFCTFLWVILLNPNEAQQQRQKFEDNPYWHREILDPKGKYQLEWRVDWSRERVEFNVTVLTRGYIVLGLSQNAKMENADIVIGGVAPNGKPYFSDRHILGSGDSVQDVSQDWVLHSAWESRTTTFLSLSRPFDTCDEDDIPISDDALYVIWAYGEGDNVSSNEWENKGTYVTHLRDPDITPRIIHEAKLNITFGGDRNRNPVVERIGDARRWAVRSIFQIPPKRTTYWCNLHKFSPPTPGKKHIIGFNARINPEAIQNLHHMILFRCRHPLGPSSTRSIFEPLLRQNAGQECYEMLQPLGPIPTQFCTEMKAGHAIGGNPGFFPDHVGLPIGEQSADEYYIMVQHYDNPDLRADITADIQMDVYYTSKLRPIDGGILSIGHHFPGVASILLPPGQVNHRVYGHCSPSCTRKMLPSQGINIFAGLLHTHTAGRRIRLQHFRRGRELPWILNDDNYQFSFQPFRILPKEIVMLPGDQVSTQCYYDTTSVNASIVGGFGTDQEMCFAFVWYHSIIQEYPTCRSEIVDPEYVKRYLAGTQNVTWQQSELEYIATSPRHLAGMTLSSISDSQYVNWDSALRAQLRRDHIFLPQQTICPDVSEAIAAASSGVAPPPPDYVSFPVNAIKYVPPQQCSL